LVFVANILCIDISEGLWYQQKNPITIEISGYFPTRQALFIKGSKCSKPLHLEKKGAGTFKRIEAERKKSCLFGT
jgi:hypothetical protein